ncbi:Crp/Fnr family transcriptional regulator [Paenibacillus sp. NPDC056579]|uniref:Crp/Fnr family transcriptional regulator n=1 Tax=Paenibacillus sp. NPDC056579 TaxID=3345871 RepID=UPI0036A60F44
MTKEPSQGTQLASYLSADNFALMRQQMAFEAKAAGSHLFWESEPAHTCFFIEQGLVKIYRITEDGQELILHLLQPGDFYAELGSGDTPFSCSAEMMKDSVIGMFSTAALEQLIASRGDFAIEFMKWMGLLHRTTQSKFRDLMMFGKNGAIASTLIRMSNTYGKPSENGILIDIKLTKTELAHLSGTTREGVSRMLSAYQANGAITYENGYLVITDLDYLRSIVQCPNCPPDICRM